MSEQEAGEQVEMEKIEQVQEVVAESVGSGGGAAIRGQSLVGVVVESPMDKTAVVAVQNTVIHPLYRRRYKKTSKFYAHDPNNETREGDHVLIVSSRPISKTKRWRVSEILQRTEEV